MTDSILNNKQNSGTGDLSSIHLSKQILIYFWMPRQDVSNTLCQGNKDVLPIALSIFLVIMLSLLPLRTSSPRRSADYIPAVRHIFPSFSHLKPKLISPTGVFRTRAFLSSRFFSSYFSYSCPQIHKFHKENLGFQSRNSWCGDVWFVINHDLFSYAQKNKAHRFPYCEKGHKPIRVHSW